VFHSVISSIIVWTRRHRLVVLGLLLCAVVVSIAGVRRLSFDQDILSLLPRDGRVIPAFREYLSRVGSLDQLYVVFTAPEGYSVGDYSDSIDAWIDALRAAPEIERVDAGTADATRDLQWLADRRLLLLRGNALEEALRRLQPDGLRSAIADSRGLLTVPSPGVADMVRYDPLGLFALVRETLGGGPQGLNLGITTGGYISADSRSRLIIARPRRPPFDSDFSRALDARLHEIEEAVGRDTQALLDEDDADDRPALEVAFAGGHRVAVETEAIVRRESILNTVGSLALILPLLFLAYRSLWLVLVGALPSGIALLLVLGGLGFAGARLSAAATGASAMLFGLGIDGVVLLYVSYLLHVASAGRDPAAGLTGPSISMLLGMWTTAATFYGLMFVDFPSLQQLGQLIGHSMLVCGVLTLLLVPALLPRRPPPTARRTVTMPRLAGWVGRHRRTVAIVATVATLALGAAATRLDVNPTLDRLRSATGAALLEAQLAETFGLPTDVYVVLASGPALEPLLEANERLASTLQRALPAVAVQAPTMLVPPAVQQSERQAAIRAAAPAPDVLGRAVDDAARAEGFRAGSFAPFVDRLPQMLAPDARLTYEGYRDHGLRDLVDRLIVRTEGGWMLVTYVFPNDAAQAGQLPSLVAGVDPAQTLTGLPMVNQELADRFLPQFLKGLAIGTGLVIMLVLIAFRDWRLSAFALLPTAIGLVWTAGILAALGIELDLFAMFAVVTFLGIGVDYGVHLVHRYQERGDALRATSELAPVILVAGAITLLGYGTLINSSYPPLRSIGIVSAVSVLALAAASVLLLPALLIRGGRPS
jgi:hypothetical protein